MKLNPKMQQEENNKYKSIKKSTKGKLPKKENVKKTNTIEIIPGHIKQSGRERASRE